MNRLVVLLAICFFLSGCASATLIKSNPSGAKLLLDGQQKGETPYTYSDRATAGTIRTVTLQKEGYKEFTSTIKREKFSVPAFIGGLFFIIPFIWITEYPSEYTFEMQVLSEKKPGVESESPSGKPTSSERKGVSISSEKASAPATLSSSAIIVTVTWTSVSVRAGAGDDQPVVTDVKQGDKLTVIGESGDWYNIRSEDGREGWVSKKGLK